MRILTLAAIAALGLTAACEREANDVDTAAEQAAVAADNAADASAAAAAAAARSATDTVTTRTVIVNDTDDDDDVTVQVGPDGVRANATIDTD